MLFKYPDCNECIYFTVNPVKQGYLPFKMFETRKYDCFIILHLPTSPSKGDDVENKPIFVKTLKIKYIQKLKTHTYNFLER